MFFSKQLEAPRCPIGCREPSVRKEWGCDEPVPEHLRTGLDCPYCNGKGEVCQVCGGSGQILLERCPRHYYGHRELFACNTVAMLESQMPPSGGGWTDMPHTLQEAVAVVSMVKESLRKETGGE